MSYDSLTIDVNGKKFKNQTITMGKKKGGEPVDEIDVFINGVYDYNIEKTASGNDIILTVYDNSSDTILGKVTIKNGAKKEFVEDGYKAYLNVNNEGYQNLTTYQYSLGDAELRKSQTLKGTALNETFNGGYADDKMYSGGGADKFVIWQGDSIGKQGDIIYGSDGNDQLILKGYNNGYTLYKEGDNLRINSESTYGTDNIIIDKYFTNPVGNRIGGDLNIGEYMDDSYIYVKGNEKKANTLVGSEFDDKIYGGNKNDKITTGEGEYDVVYGGKGNDDITINSLGSKTIYMEQGDGNDTVNIDLSKPMVKGSSTESIPYSPAVYQTDGDLYVDAEFDDDAYLTYTKRGADIIITAEHNDGTSETLTVKNYFNLSNLVSNIVGNVMSSLPASETSPINYDLTVNENDVKSKILPNEELTIAGVKVSELIKMIEKEIPSDQISMVDGIIKKLKLPSGLSNANVFLGTETDNYFFGSNNKDLMIATGGYNLFRTGEKGQSVIASLGKEEDDMDYYSISSFDAGTAIIDRDGKYHLDMYNADTNDIHFIGSNMGGVLPIAALKGTTTAATTTTTMVEVLTDSKGIKNLESIDFVKIYEKIMEVKDAIVSGDSNEKIKTIGSAISMANGLIDKFRGVAVVTQKTVSGESLIPKGSSASVYDEIRVTDKKDKNQFIQVISPETQETAEYFLTQSMSTFASNISHKFYVDMDDLMQILANPDGVTFDAEDIQNRINNHEIDNAFVKKYYKKVDNHYVLSKTAINEIKSDLFDVFQNSFVGTDGDNSFSVSASNSGAAVATGYGNDTITFNGDIGAAWYDNKPYSYSYYDYPEYNVVSSLAAGEHDTLVFKNYTLGTDLFPGGAYYLSAKKGSYSNINGLNWDLDNLKVYGMNLYVDKCDKNYESGSYGEINYYLNEKGGSGYSFENSQFALTLKDKSKTYQVTLEHDDTSINYNWSGDKDSHIATLVTKDATVKTGKGINLIGKYSTSGISKAPGNPTMEYTYGGGQDMVMSYDTSDDTYNVNLTGKTNLMISDHGIYDNDSLILSNDYKSAKNARIYFNVNNSEMFKSSSDFEVNIVSGKLSKSSFNIEEGGLKSSSYKYVEGMKNGIEFNYNGSGYTSNYGVEEVYIDNGSSYVSMNYMINSIHSEVATWLDNHDSYSSTNDVIANGKAGDVKELLAIYNSYNLGDWSAA